MLDLETARYFAHLTPEAAAEEAEIENALGSAAEGLEFDRPAFDPDAPLDAV